MSLHAAELGLACSLNWQDLAVRWLHFCGCLCWEGVACLGCAAASPDTGLLSKDHGDWGLRLCGVMPDSAWVMEMHPLSRAGQQAAQMVDTGALASRCTSCAGAWCRATC